MDIQFDSSKFTAAIRGSSSFGCKGAKDTPAFSAKTQKTETIDNEQTLARRRMSKKTKREEHGTYHQQESKSD
jgi:hypothetical protein